ncbi:hypothetical protein SteCoe_5472 [Stentor coeruleus]|uniref:pyruvate kinase n=1 Tax=Stentor coeruleus TaxID=5963 RepID=A0A1R2CSD2_9CILI|nr:hypothetical protein SteCoe_5472 [Stentor coeruleus]
MVEESSNIKRKTKIIVTLGESSSSKGVLVELIKAGMDVARISNRFLKGEKQDVLINLQEAIKETGIHVGVMLGLRESDIRIGTFGKSPLRLKKNDLVRISTHAEQSEINCTLWCNNKEFSSMVTPGDKLLVDFGKIILTVLSNESSDSESYSFSRSFTSIASQDLNLDIDSSKSGNIMYMLNSTQKIESSLKRQKTNSFNENLLRPKRITPKNHRGAKIVMCRVENDCTITVHKPVHISSSDGHEIPTSDATVSEDFKLIEWANENNVDFIVFKQVRNEEDLGFLMDLASSNIKKFLGLQNKGTVTQFEKLITETDGVVIGRGTLALETSLADVCRIQKKTVKRCNELGKPVIISTQLLESMVFHNTPTRSEVTDITNAVLDGTDALMLSGETAYGHDPVRAFNACARICIEAEKYLDCQGECERIKKLLGNNITITENTCYSAVTTVLSTHAKVIVCLTESGRTAQIISRFMPPCAIVSLTNSEVTERQMRIIRGVYPFFVKETQESELKDRIFEIVKTGNFAEVGDNIVVVGGLLYNFAAGHTCSLKILVVK